MHAFHKVRCKLYMIPLIIKTEFRKNTTMPYLFLHELGLYLEDLGHDNVYYCNKQALDLNYTKTLRLVTEEELDDMAPYNILSTRLTSDVCYNVDKINKVYLYVSPFNFLLKDLLYFYYQGFFNIPLNTVYKLLPKLVFIQDRSRMTYDHTQKALFKDVPTVSNFTWGIYDKYFTKNNSITNKTLLYIDINKNYKNCLNMLHPALREMINTYSPDIYYNMYVKDIEKHISTMSKHWSTYDRLICIYKSSDITTLPYRFGMCNKESVLLNENSTLDDFVFQVRKPESTLNIQLSDF